ncbi:MAG: hypothetical protein KAI55_01905 [Candidatus Aenigmarchaeota archaeon]|nr:hypothetical protein [Candidatus Aenigmarchaeota archaeon]
MDWLKSILSSILFIILFSSSAFCYSVGATPLVSNFGTISKGETITKYIFLSTNSREDIVLNTGYIQPHYNVFMDEMTAEKYMYDPNEISLEDISSWISIKKDIKFSSSSSINIPVPKEYHLNPNSVIPVKITVPYDAEPGIHIMSISMSAKFAKTIGQPAVRLAALTRPSIIFRVPGKVSVNGEITQMSGQRVDDTSVNINYYLKNTGTITVLYKFVSMKIYDQYDDIIFETEGLGDGIISPTKTFAKTTVWNSRKKIEDGKYKVKIAIDARGKKIYKTGYIIVTSDISPTGMMVSGIMEDDEDSILSKDVSTQKCGIYWFWVIFASVLITMFYYHKEEYAQKDELLKIFIACIIVFFILNYLYCFLI